MRRLGPGLVIGVCASVLAGSAAMAGDTEQQDFCQLVQALAANSPSGFAVLKGAPWDGVDDQGTVWHANVNLAPSLSGQVDHCMIRRANGRDALHCQIVDQAVGELDHNMQVCLQGWTRTDISDESDETPAKSFITFEQPGTKTFVMVQGFEPGNVWLGISEKTDDDGR